MLGSETPDLDETPCAGCGESLAETPRADLRWDPWQSQDPRLAALPYHTACAQAAGILPPAEPEEAHARCGRCQETLGAETLAVAYRALHTRFETAKGSLISPEVVWRVKSRDPRSYVAEHFACLLGAVVRKKPKPEDEKLPELPGLDGGA